MILTFIFLFTALGYFIYKSKNELILLEQENIESKHTKVNDDDDDLFKELEDLFI